MNKVAIAEKKQSVAELTESLKKSKSYLLFEYHGATALAMGALRRKMGKSGGQILVFKNTMLERAFSDVGATELTSYLSGPNAIAFGYEDEIAPFKTIVQAVKDKLPLKIKAGFLDGKPVDAKKAAQLADIPSRSDHYAMIASMLSSPVASFARAVDGIAKAKAAAAPAPAAPA